MARHSKRERAVGGEDKGPGEVRRGGAEDLEAVNRVVEAAVMGWDLPERVKRLARVSYRDRPGDRDHLELLVAADSAGEAVGVAAIEEAPPAHVPAGRRGLSLHGLYVHPQAQGQGFGSRLLAAAAERARARGCDGLLVRANREAVGFFAARGLATLPVEDPSRDYPHRFWLEVRGG
jgi:GNAT superfamily N-acetyltransferase